MTVPPTGATDQGRLWRFERSITDSSGRPRASFRATDTLTRSQYGIVAELDEEADSTLIGDVVTLDLEIKARP